MNFGDLVWDYDLINQYITGVGWMKSDECSDDFSIGLDIVQNGRVLYVPYMSLYVYQDNMSTSQSAEVAGWASSAGRIIIMDIAGLNYFSGNLVDHLILDWDDNPYLGNINDSLSFSYVTYHELMHIIGITHHEEAVVGPNTGSSSDCEGSIVLGDQNANHCIMLTGDNLQRDNNIVWPYKLCPCCWARVSVAVSDWKENSGRKF